MWERNWGRHGATPRVLGWVVVDIVRARRRRRDAGEEAMLIVMKTEMNF